MRRFFENSTIFYVSGIFAGAILFVIPIWLYGIPRSHDTIHHFQTANALYEMLISGEIFPVWAGAQNEGYGGIVLRLYPPLSYLVLAIGKIVGGNWQNAGCLAFLLWTFIGGSGTFFWSRIWFSEKSSFAAAILFIFSPYHAMQLYSAFVYAEFAAVSLLPFCFLFTTKICRNPAFKNVAFFGAVWALLVLTHLPLALIGSIALFLHFLVCPKNGNFKRAFLGFSGGIIIGSAASGFQLIRVLSEMNFVGIAGGKFSAQGFYDYKQNFLLSFPYLNGLEADVHQLWFFDLALVITLLSIIPCAIVFLIKTDSAAKHDLRGIWVLCAFTFFMMTLPSFPLWENLPLLQKVQFPWRWFGVFASVSIIFVAAGCEHLGKLAKSRTRPFLLLTIGSLLIGLSFTLSQVIRQAIFISDEDFARMTNEMSVKSDFEEWLPVWANKDTASIREKVLSERKAEIRSWTSAEKIFTVEAGNETAARVAAFYYPYWSATVNGKFVDVNPSADGAISIPLSTAKSEVTLRFTEPRLHIFSFFLTLAVFTAIIAFGLWNTSLKSKI